MNWRFWTIPRIMMFLGQGNVETFGELPVRTWPPHLLFFVTISNFVSACRLGRHWNFWRFLVMGKLISAWIELFTNLPCGRALAAVDAKHPEGTVDRKQNNYTAIATACRLKVDVSNSNTTIIWTPIVQWNEVRFECKNRHQKRFCDSM